MVAQESSFSRAAEHLYMTQAAVSQHIHDLEIALGAQLFTRKPAGVQLTDAGARLLDYTKQIRVLVAQAENELTQVANLPHGTLLIGALPHAAAFILPLWVQPFLETYPQFTVSIQPETAEVIIDRVADGLLDLGFVNNPGEHPRLVFSSLPDCEVGIITSRDHPLSSRGSISARELNGQPFITFPARHSGNLWTNQLFTRMDITPRMIAELDDVSKILELIASQGALAFMPRCLIQGRKEYTYLALNDVNEINNPLFLVTPSDMPVSAITRAFLTQMSLNFTSLKQILTGSPDQYL